jgi:hydrogenase maturation protease
MTPPRVLVAGIGNVFLGDDGFGVAVAGRLRTRSYPAGVEVVEFGIRGFDLAYALARYDAAILVDTVSRGGPPGTLYVLEPEQLAGPIAASPHSMTPDRVLRWVPEGCAPKTIRIVGCQPATFGPEGVGFEGLSSPVQAAVDEAMLVVDSLIGEFTSGGIPRA